MFCDSQKPNHLSKRLGNGRQVRLLRTGGYNNTFIRNGAQHTLWLPLQTTSATPSQRSKCGDTIELICVAVIRCRLRYGEGNCVVVACNKTKHTKTRSLQRTDRPIHGRSFRS